MANLTVSLVAFATALARIFHSLQLGKLIRKGLFVCAFIHSLVVSLCQPLDILQISHTLYTHEALQAIWDWASGAGGSSSKLMLARAPVHSTTLSWRFFKALCALPSAKRVAALSTLSELFAFFCAVSFTLALLWVWTLLPGGGISTLLFCGAVGALLAAADFDLLEAAAFALPCACSFLLGPNMASGSASSSELPVPLEDEESEASSSSLSPPYSPFLLLKPGIGGKRQQLLQRQLWASTFHSYLVPGMRAFPAVMDCHRSPSPAQLSLGTLQSRRLLSVPCQSSNHAHLGPWYFLWPPWIDQTLHVSWDSRPQQTQTAS